MSIKLCKECKHCKKPDKDEALGLWWREHCMRMHPLTGFPIRKQCRSERKPGGACGFGARMWEAMK